MQTVNDIIDFQENEHHIAHLQTKDEIIVFTNQRIISKKTGDNGQNWTINNTDIHHITLKKRMFLNAELFIRIKTTEIPKEWNGWLYYTIFQLKGEKPIAADNRIGFPFNKENHRLLSETLKTIFGEKFNPDFNRTSKWC